MPTTVRHRPTEECSAGPPGDCDLVTVPTRQGLEAVDILRRGCTETVGPVLHDGGETLGFLVPPGTADGWDLPGSDCTRTRGRGPVIGSGPQPPLDGSGWLLPPDPAERPADLVTDPAVLRAALDEAARLIEAADNHR
ncbi:hypothetical protein ABZY90_02010 [Streptomyces sp. NPDC006422]|uniref:hypothetical protein n=1 Tax=unclassified Streptomyces TaxID=2593676 RepID=UPI0033A17B4B